MKTDAAAPPTLKDVLSYALAYLLWLVNIGVGIATVVQIRSALNVLWLALGHSQWTLGLVDQLSVLLGGLAVFVYAMFLEGYYRTSVTPRDRRPQIDAHVPAQAQAPHVGLNALLRRFALTTAIPLGVYVASRATVELAWRILVR